MDETMVIEALSSSAPPRLAFGH